jgi:tetratricopeptide (TPR) repeat protein
VRLVIHNNGSSIRRLAVVAVIAACGPSRSVETAATQGAVVGEDRPLLVEFSATWCGPCKYFERSTLTDNRVKRALEDVRFLRIDGEREPGEARRCGVTSYPTFVVVNERGTVVARMKGAAGAVKFIDFLQWGAPNAFDEASIARRMRERPSVRGLLYEARLHAMKGHMREAVTAYRAALAAAADGARKADIEWEIALLESAGGTLADLTARAARFAVEHPQAANALAAVEIALVSGTLSPADAAVFGHRILAIYGNDGAALNGLAYAFLTARAFDDALSAARRQIEVAPREANAYDTLAEVHHQRGERAAALANADRAIALARESDSRAAFEANRARFADRVRDPGTSLDGTKDRFERVLQRYRIAP